MASYQHKWCGHFVIYLSQLFVNLYVHCTAHKNWIMLLTSLGMYVPTQARSGDPGQGGAVSVGPFRHACIAIRPAKHRRGYYLEAASSKGQLASCHTNAWATCQKLLRYLSHKLKFNILSCRKSLTCSITLTHVRYIKNFLDRSNFTHKPSKMYNFKVSQKVDFLFRDLWKKFTLPHL